MNNLLNPQKTIPNKFEDFKTTNDQRVIFQNVSLTLLQQIHQTHKNKTLQVTTNSRIPSIFKKNSLIQVIEDKVANNDGLVANQPSNQHKIILNIGLQSKVHDSVCFPQITNSPIRLKWKSCQKSWQFKKSKNQLSTININTPSKTRNRQSRKTIAKNKILINPRSPSPPSFLKKTSKATNMDEKKVISISDFKFGKLIGVGLFGQYLKAIHKESGMIVCIKRLVKQKVTKSGYLDKVVKSIRCNFILQHPNIRKIYGIFQDYKNVYLIFQYTQLKTLNSLLKYHRLKQVQWAEKLKEVASAVKYINNKNLVHRNINCESIQITYGVCKICDFELIKQVTQPPNDKVTALNYEKKYIPYSYDIWCLGMLAFEMLGTSTNNSFYQNDHNKIEFPTNISPSIKNLILKLIEPIPSNRITIDEILNHPLINQNIEETIVPTQFIKLKKVLSKE